MVILAIDPGNEKSAIVYYDTVDQIILRKGIVTNREMLLCVKAGEDDHLVVEMIASYGMSVGQTVFDTCVWIGRFIEASPNKHTLIYRRDVKLHFCGQARAKDGNVIQALKDRFGDKGTKKNPGFFYGFSADMWQAFAVGAYYCDAVLNKVQSQAASNTH